MFRRGPKRAVVVLIAALIATPFSYGFSDPTQPSQYRVVAKRVQLKLESVLVSDTRKVAVINGQVVAEGEKIGGARVVSIGKDKVRLLKSGKTISLTLEQPQIRQDN